MVKGYRGGTWNEDDRAFTVTGDMAHLWVEVYFIGAGWVRFDPSPRGTEEAAVGWRSFAQELGLITLRARMYWYQNVVGFESFINMEDLQRFRLAAIPAFFGGSSGHRAPAEPPDITGPVSAVTYYWQTVLGLIGFALSGWMFLRAGKAPHRPRYTLSDDQERAAELYRMLQRRLGRLGIETENKTARQLVEAARAWAADANNGGHAPGNSKKPVAPDLAEATVRAAERIAQLYEEARFGLRSLDKGRYKNIRQEIARLGTAP